MYLNTMINIKMKSKEKKKSVFQIPQIQDQKNQTFLIYQNTLLGTKLTSFFLSGISCLYIAWNNLSYNRNRGKYKI